MAASEKRIGLPNRPEFEAFLSTLHLRASAKREDGPWFRAVSGAGVLTPAGISATNVDVGYAAAGELTLGGVLKAVCRELEKAGHVVSEDIAKLLLAYHAAFSSDAASHVERFNTFFRIVSDSDVEQLMVTPLPSPAGFQFDLQGFHVGPFDRNRFAYWCKKLGADYHETRADRLRNGTLSIVRTIKHHFRICWNRLAQLGVYPLVDERQAPLNSWLVDSYFAVMSDLLFRSFFAAFENAQSLSVAMGAGFLPPSSMIGALGAEKVTMFFPAGEEAHGWITGLAPGPPFVDLGGVHIGIAKSRSALREDFGFPETREGDIFRAVDRFSHFCMLAERHGMQGNSAERILHYVIALDLLLSENGATTRTVTRRTAAIVHRAFGLSYAEALKECEDFYEIRSLYVHAGKIPEVDAGDRLRELCGQIVFTLLHLQKDPGNRANGFRDRWTRNLDMVAAILEAGKQPSPAYLREAGILAPEDQVFIAHREFLRNGPPPISVS